jgi:hypothetical protein
VGCEDLYTCLPFRLVFLPCTSLPDTTTGTSTSSHPAYPAYSNTHPGPNQLAQARVRACGSEEEGGGEDGAFALRMREEARCSGAG